MTVVVIWLDVSSFCLDFPAEKGKKKICKLEL